MDKLLNSEFSMVEPGHSGVTSSAAQYSSDASNPVARLSQVWRIMERIALSVSLVVVLGTIGYVSIYVFA